MARLTVGLASATGGSGVSIHVQAELEFFTRLEERYPFFLDEHRISGSGITTGSRWAMSDGECAEAPKLDPVAVFQRLSDVVQYRVNDTPHIAMTEMWIV
jgi:hypothetical protein